MKIAVLGAGAMGSLFGGRLAEAGFDVTLIDVDPGQIEAVRREGLCLESDDGDRRVRLPIGRAEEFRQPADLLIVFTKTMHTAAALESVRHLICAETHALTLQNGLGTGERLERVLPRQRILVGITNWPAALRESGRVSSHGTGEVRLWTLDGRESPAVGVVCEALVKAKLRCTADAQVRAAIWEKVAFNAAMNSVAAATGYDVGRMADDADIRDVQLAIVRETVSVAQACGIAASGARIEAAVHHAWENHRAHEPSMLQDVLAGRPTEVEAINGAIVEHARAAGCAAPVVEVFLRLVRARAREVRCA